MNQERYLALFYHNEQPILSARGNDLHKVIENSNLILQSESPKMLCTVVDNQTGHIIHNWGSDSA